jgi:lipoyl(octanoyl) transferase
MQPLLWLFVVLVRSLPILLSAFRCVIPHNHRNGYVAKVSSRCHKLLAFQQQLGTYEELKFEDEQFMEPKSRRVIYYDFTTMTSPLSSVDVSITTLDNSHRNSNKMVHLPPGTPIEYHTAWDMQKEFLQSHIDRLSLSMVTAGTTCNRSGTLLQKQSSLSSFIPLDKHKNCLIGVDTILFVEHEPVYTLGTGSDASFIMESSGTNNPPVVRIDRGGEVTYHGPGQLTVYPILDLRNYNQDIHWYVRALEEAIVRALNAVLTDYVEQSKLLSTTKYIAKREENITGVWIDEYKVAAIGVKCKKWITQHGFAINVTPESMEYIANIIPCGLVGRKVGCVNQFLAPSQPITVSQMTQYVIKALEDVFQIQLIPNEQLPSR